MGFITDYCTGEFGRAHSYRKRDDCVRMLAQYFLYRKKVTLFEYTVAALSERT